MAEIAKIIRVSGTVQGVSFRFYTQCEAEKLGVRGYARNLPDGRVEVFAEGEAARVRQLVSWLRQGPDTAVVDGITEEDVSLAQHQGFVTG
ncbi:acylphosphatase [Oceanisphaera psychrotolerans]|uniref:Acylphosphatase n=1 Tax=Oceanisphaera psychrotolerans TaxID=1414654 RepID=A0A1J4QGT9_9GAMM|nr:acylphosphatase [Oceanisphaera psychrotolerans]OIN14034.1 acylphosphatase [Oceanisphaera psychrotolerans]